MSNLTPAHDIIEFDLAINAEAITLTIDVHFKRNRDFTILKLQCVGTSHVLPDSSPLYLRGWYLKLPVKYHNLKVGPHSASLAKLWSN